MSEQKERKVEDIKKEAEERHCPAQKTLYYIDSFLADIMCGKCFPCAFGTYEAKIRLKDIIFGKGTEADIVALKEIVRGMIEASRCKRGKDTGQFVLEWIETDSFKQHIGKRCPEHECLSLIEYRIDPDKCIMCGECLVVCKYNAIVGEKKIPYLSGYLPFEIIQKKCTRCGECIKVCPTNAITVVDLKTEAEVKV
jgi:ferredoxin